MFVLHLGIVVPRFKTEWRLYDEKAAFLVTETTRLVIREAKTGHTRVDAPDVKVDVVSLTVDGEEYLVPDITVAELVGRVRDLVKFSRRG